MACEAGSKGMLLEKPREGTSFNFVVVGNLLCWLLSWVACGTYKGYIFVSSLQVPLKDVGGLKGPPIRTDNNPRGKFHLHVFEVAVIDAA